MIIKFGNPVLKEKASLILEFGNELSDLSERLLSAIYSTGAYGLASQHIGELKAICLINLPSELLQEKDVLFNGEKVRREGFMPLFLVNPVVFCMTNKLVRGIEGSVSFPGIQGEVERYDEIQVEFSNLHGERQTVICSGLLARCIQHEVDQLNGVPFIERMDTRTRNALNAKLKKLKRAYLAEG